MENYTIKLLKRELDTLKMFKDGYEKQQIKRSGEELKFVEEQLFEVNNNISTIEKSIQILINA